MIGFSLNQKPFKGNLEELSFISQCQDLDHIKMISECTDNKKDVDSYLFHKVEVYEFPLECETDEGKRASIKKRKNYLKSVNSLRPETLMLFH